MVGKWWAYTVHCFVARSDSTAKFSIRGEAHEFIYGRALVAAEYPAKKDAAYNVKQFVLVKSFLVVSRLVLSRGKVRYLFYVPPHACQRSVL